MDTAHEPLAPPASDSGQTHPLELPTPLLLSLLLLRLLSRSALPLLAHLLHPPLLPRAPLVLAAAVRLPAPVMHARAGRHPAQPRTPRGRTPTPVSPDTGGTGLQPQRAGGAWGGRRGGQLRRGGAPGRDRRLVGGRRLGLLPGHGHVYVFRREVPAEEHTPASATNSRPRRRRWLRGKVGGKQKRLGAGGWGSRAEGRRGAKGAGPGLTRCCCSCRRRCRRRA